VTRNLHDEAITTPDNEIRAVLLYFYIVHHLFV
jgi:hypothetical protein